MFERFWRGDTSRAGTGVHFGLGLALAQRVVESLGGTAAASAAGGTFTIRLTLPAPHDTPRHEVMSLAR